MPHFLRRLHMINSAPQSTRLTHVLVCLIVVLVAAPGLAAQERSLVGHVREAGTQRALAAQVSVPGTTLGVMADEAGRFLLRLPQASTTLYVQLIGYKPVEVQVGAEQTEVEIFLETDVLGLEEIVVTGRATGVRRRNLANDVASVSGADLTPVAASSVEQQLAGKLAGANIQSNSGAPGGGMQVQLRGVSTIIGAHTPLYVVDGVIVSDDVVPSGVFEVTVSSSDPVQGGSQDNSANRIADLNPNDIESIEVLKGASAAAMYGSRANNGVILITTKRGTPGETRYSLQQRIGTARLSNKLGMRRFQSREEAVTTFGSQAGEYWAADRFFDHEEELAGNTPLLFELSGSASGAVGGTRFFLSGLVQDEGGVVENTGYAKQSVRVNLSQQLGERLSLDVSTNAVHSLAARGITNNDNRSISYWMTFPYTPSFVDLRPDENGVFPDNPFSQSNPLQTAALTTNDEEVWRFIGGVNATFEAFRDDRQGLRFLGVAGYDYFNQRNTVITPAVLQFEPLDGLPGTSVGASAVNQSVNLGLNAVHDLFLGSSTTATTSLGVQYESRDLAFSRVSARGLIAGQTNLNRATSAEIYQNRERVEDVGFFFQEELLLSERLFLNAGIRADYSSNNSNPSDVFWYPKGAASYRFIDPIPGVDEVKVRAAYGESGNRPIYGQKFTQYLGQNIEGLPTLSVGNVTSAPDLRPERQQEIEAGLDLILFGERATLRLTAYQKNVSDVLLERQLPTSSGFGTAVFNGGKIRIRGLEAALEGAPIQGRDVLWTTNANFSLNRGILTDLPVPPFVTGGFGFLFGAFYAEEGGSLTSVWGNTTLDDGSVVQANLGDSNPDFKVGFSNTFGWRNFELYSLLDWQQGGTVVNLTQLLYDLAGNSADCNDIVGGESACARRVAAWPTDTSVYLYDASFVKLREMTLTWRVPQDMLQSFFFGARSASLSLGGRNLLVFTDYPGMDPEVSNFGSQAIGRNVDVAPYPPSRTFWFTINLGL